MRSWRVIVGTSLIALAGCSHMTAASAAPTASGMQVEGVTPRARPPIVASHCAGLSPQELQEASDYVFKLSRIEPLHPADPRLPTGNPSVLIGITMYLPAERCISAAYLERLLSCHAIRVADASEHPNDPLLAPGITSVDVAEADGGQYRVSLTFAKRSDGAVIMRRVHALQQSRGSVHIQQLDPPAPQ